MAISGITRQAYLDFLANGGKITVIIDSSDISETNDFEDYPLIKPLLTSGFEIKPTTIINSLEFKVEMTLHGDNWGIVVMQVYNNNGSIVYKKQSNGSFQAVAEF